MTWRNKWQENVYVIRSLSNSLLSGAKTYRCYREIILDIVRVHDVEGIVSIIHESSWTKSRICDEFCFMFVMSGFI